MAPFLGYILKITHLNAFTHTAQAGGQLFDQVHLNGEGDGQIRILVGGVDRAANVEVDVRRLLKQEAANERGAVTAKIPGLIILVIRKVISRASVVLS